MTQIEEIIEEVKDMADPEDWKYGSDGYITALRDVLELLKTYLDSEISDA